VITHLMSATGWVEFASRWFIFILDASLKSAIVLAFAFALAAGMRRASASARQAVWLLSLLSLLALPVLSAALPGWRILPQWARWNAVAAGAGNVVVAPTEAGPHGLPEAFPSSPHAASSPDRAVAVKEKSPSPGAEGPPATTPQAAQPPAADPRFPATPTQAGRGAIPLAAWMSLLWGLGAALCLIPLALGHFSLRRLKRGARRIAGGPWLALLENAALQLGLRRRVVLFESDRRTMPMIWGTARPCLLLPATAAQWSAERRWAVVLHELAHVKRWDCLAKMAAHLVCAAYWFNPLAWLAFRRLQIEAERVCDDLVLASGYRPEDYADDILQIASGLQANLLAAHNSIAMARSSKLEGRLLAILDRTRSRRKLTLLGGLLVASLVIAFVVPVAILRVRAEEEKPGGPVAATLGPAANHLLFVRHNEVNGAADSDTLALGKVIPGEFMANTPSGFEIKDLYTQAALTAGFHLFGVWGGKAFARERDDLLCFDVESGQRVRIASNLRCHAYADGRLFCPSGDSAIREYDFRAQCYRDIPLPSGELAGLSSYRAPWAVAPDARRLAFFKAAPDRSVGSSQLTVVELATGDLRPLGAPVRYSERPISSFAASGPPLTWLDAQTIAFVRTQTPERSSARASGAIAARRLTEDWDKTINYLVLADVVQGQVRDFAPLPGNFVRTLIEIREPKPFAPAVVVLNFAAPQEMSYAVDLKSGKLVESQAIGRDFAMRRQGRKHQLFAGDKMIFETDGYIYAAVSPDQKSVIWNGNFPARELFYYNAESGIRRLAGGWFTEHMAWVAEGALAPSPSPSQPPAGWTPFERLPYPEPSPPDMRKAMADFLTFTITCDKPTYRQHEPVEVTMTLANKSSETFEISPPIPNRSVAEIRLEGAGRGKELDYFWGGEQINPVRIVTLKGGQSVGTTFTLEVAGPGAYKIQGNMNVHGGRFKIPIALRGNPTAAPYSFTVEASPDDADLFKAKFERLMRTLRAQQAKGPEWDGWLPAADSITDMGRPASPYLMEAIGKESNPLIARQLLGSLNRVAGPESLSFYREMAARGDPELAKEALRGLHEMYKRSAARDGALEALLEIAGRKDLKTLQSDAAAYLVGIHEPSVKKAFEQAVAEEDPLICDRAARYLAADEDMSLADWLATAAQNLTHARFLAARVIIADLANTWHLTDKKDLTGLAWKDVSENAGKMAQARQAILEWEKWARENPRASATYFDRDREPWAKVPPR